MRLQRPVCKELVRVEDRLRVGFYCQTLDRPLSSQVTIATADLMSATFTDRGLFHRVLSDATMHVVLYLAINAHSQTIPIPHNLFKSFVLEILCL